MTTSTTVNKPTIHYLYDDVNKIIYYSEEMPEDRHDLIYLGQSNHPNPRGGAAHLVRTMEVNTGYKVRPL